MMKIRLTDGSIYIGKDEADLIMQLKLEDWTSYKNVKAYKKNIKRRVKIFNGCQISYNNDLEFLQELQRVEFIKDIENI